MMPYVAQGKTLRQPTALTLYLWTFVFPWMKDLKGDHVYIFYLQWPMASRAIVIGLCLPGLHSCICASVSLSINIFPSETKE